MYTPLKGTDTPLERLALGHLNPHPNLRRTGREHVGKGIDEDAGILLCYA